MRGRRGTSDGGRVKAEGRQRLARREEQKEEVEGEAVVTDISRLVEVAFKAHRSTASSLTSSPLSNRPSSASHGQAMADGGQSTHPQPRPPTRSLSMLGNDEEGEDDADPLQRRAVSIAELHRREDEEIDELYAVQDMLDSFYDHVQHQDDEEEEEQNDDSTPTPRRKRRDYRQLRYNGERWQSKDCIRVGWFTVREEPLPAVDGAVAEEVQDGEEVELVVVEKSEPLPFGTPHYTRYLQLFSDRLVRRLLRTRTPLSRQRQRQKTRKANAKRQKRRLEKAPEARDYIRIDLSASDDDSPYLSPSSDSEEEKEEDDSPAFTETETFTRSLVPVNAPLPLHPLSVILTHRPDNSITADVLQAVTALHLKGLLALSCTRDAKGRCYLVKVALTPLALSDDGRPSAEERSLLRVAMRWAADCGEWEDEEQRHRAGDDVFDPTDLYAAALPPKASALPPQRRTAAPRFSRLLRNGAVKRRRVHVMEEKGDVPDGSDDDDEAMMAEEPSDEEADAQLSAAPTGDDSSCALTHAQLSSLGLLPQLRPYQLHAASWMLQREAMPALDPALHLSELSVFWKECRLFEACPVTGVERLWFDVVRGVVARRVVDGEALTEVRGGLLCDEMGLGQ